MYTKQTALNMRNYSCLQQFNASVCVCIGLKPGFWKRTGTLLYVSDFRGMTNFNKWTCRSCMNKTYVQKRISYRELLPAVSIELASIKSTQCRSATINAVIKCNQRLSILYMTGDVRWVCKILTLFSDFSISIGITYNTIQYNTIFVYCEMTERSSTRDNNIRSSNSLHNIIFVEYLRFVRNSTFLLYKETETELLKNVK